MKNKKIISLVILAVIFCISIMPISAASTQQRISDANSEKKAAELKLQEQQAAIQELLAGKGEQEEYLKSLNTQLDAFQTNIKELQTKLTDKEADLERLKGSLERAKTLEKDQYEEMKLRIQYIYENPNSSYIELLLVADSFSDFLNKADAIAELSAYDRNMLEDYSKTRSIIATQEQQAEQDKQSIQQLKKDQEDQQAVVEQLITVADKKLASFKSQIEAAKSDEAIYVQRIEEQKRNINDLIAKSRQEQEEKAKQEEAIKKAQENNRKNQAKVESNTKQEADNSTSQGNSQSAGQEVAQDSKQEAVKTESNQGQMEDGDSRGGSEEYLGRFKLTAYCWCEVCNGRAGHPTASGTTPVAGRTVAMSGVPFGTKLRINGQIYVVEDRGTSYGHVDIFHGSHSAALSFGLQYADVYLIH